MSTLPPLDSEALRLAVEAYRLACTYGRHIDAKWEPRAEELRRLDAFHRTRVASENDSYRAERLVREAADVVLRAARGARLLPRDPFLSKSRLYASRDRVFVRALRALDAARARVGNATSITEV